jgi:hypothetical protein
MESEKNALLAQSVEEDQQHYSEPNEWRFERDWWAESSKELTIRNYAEKTNMRISKPKSK